MTARALRVGIDVGSTTVKVVALDAKNGDMLFTQYKRHFTEQAATVRHILEECAVLFPDSELRAAVCGSGGKPVAEALGVYYVQEVVANSIVARLLYPETRTSIEIGGQDSKAIFFYFDGKTKRLMASDMRMNGSCAGGTGAFIDEIANLLKVPIDEYNALAAKATATFNISGRCGVFAKTDIQSILNQGGRREDIALSAFHAIVKQTIGGLAQGLELKPPVFFAGGPITFNPELVKAFAERLKLTADDIIIPENPETIIARGAALAIDELFPEGNEESEKLKLAILIDRLSKNKKAAQTKGQDAGNLFFSSNRDYENWMNRHANTLPNSPLKTPEQAVDNTKETRVYIGIDAGSTTSKFIVMDEDENILDFFYSRNNGDPLRVIKQGLIDMYKKFASDGVNLKVCGLGATGYGELLFSKAYGADFHTVETVAHAAAAQKYMPDVSFILDIGGQDMKAIWIKDGVITNITLNEACSSGCGSFLESFADSLGIATEDIAKLAFQAKHPAELGSRCTVFMNSTIITEQKNGKQSDDIMAGLCRAIIENVFTKVIRVTNNAFLGDCIVVQGGTFKNDAVLRALEQYLNVEVFRAPYPGEMGCIGAALLTKRHIKQSGQPDAKSSFIGFDEVEKFDYTQNSNVPCNLCSNNCMRTQVIFSNGASLVTGNRCERGECVAEQEKNAPVGKQAPAPNMFSYREQMLFKTYDFTQVSGSKNITIGLPRVLEFWDSMPFWTTFFHALGFQIKISNPSSEKQYEKGIPFVVSDTICFPAKIAHGHIQDLVEQCVNRIFMPMIMEMPSEGFSKDSNHVCPVLKGYPYVIRNSESPETRWNVKFDSPIFHWFGSIDKRRQLSKYMVDEFDIAKKETLEAIKQGEAALKQFHASLVNQGEKIAAEVKKSGNFAVVLAGRPYHNDSLVSHDLSRVFTKAGIPVLTLDSLSGMEKVNLKHTRMEITNNFHMRMLSGAMIASERSELEYVQIVSFGCGHDAILSDEIIRIMNDVGGKVPLVLKIDEGEAANSLNIRIKSFINTVSNRRKNKNPAEIKSLNDAYPVKFIKSDRKIRTILVPNVSVAFCKLMSAVLTKLGLKIEPLPLGGINEIALGKKYVHNDTCFPAQMVIGEALAVLQSGKYKTDEVAVAMAKLHGDCRISHYPALLRRALDEAGFADVPVVTTDPTDSKSMHPGIKLKLGFEMPSIWALIMAEILEELCRQIRPYERHPGETDSAFYDGIDYIASALPKGINRALDAYRAAIDRFCRIPYDTSNPKPRVFVTGEFLVNFHPGSNFHIEEYLEANGMEVIFPRLTNVFRKDVISRISHIKDFNVGFPLSEVLFTYVKDGLFSFIVNKLEGIASKHPLHTAHIGFSQLADNIDSIMHRTYTSGEGWLIPAEIKEYAEMGVSAFVILQPFGCLPNHICGRGAIKRIKEEFPLIQILPIDLDPDSSFANIENRLQMLIINEKNRFYAAKD